MYAQLPVMIRQSYFGNMALGAFQPLFDGKHSNVLLKIFNNLPPLDLSACREVCPQFREFIDDAILGDVRTSANRLYRQYSDELWALSDQLISACRTGDDPELVRRLIGVPEIDVNATSGVLCGDTVFSTACRGDSTEIVKILLGREDLKVNAPFTDEPNKNGFQYEAPPLLLAVFRDRLEIVKLLVSVKRIDVNAANSYGINPLIYCAKEGKEDMLSLLLTRHDLDVNRGDYEKGKTALMWASDMEHTPIVKTLLDHPSTDFYARDKMGHTASDYAEGNAEIERLVKEKETMLGEAGRLLRESIEGVRNDVDWAKKRSRNKCDLL